MSLFLHLLLCTGNGGFRLDPSAVLSDWKSRWRKPRAAMKKSLTDGIYGCSSVTSVIGSSAVASFSPIFCQTHPSWLIQTVPAFVQLLPVKPNQSCRYNKPVVRLVPKVYRRWTFVILVGGWLIREPARWHVSFLSLSIVPPFPTSIIGNLVSKAYRSKSFLPDRLLCPDHPIGVNVSYNPKTGDRREFERNRQNGWHPDPSSWSLVSWLPGTRYSFPVDRYG